jgi:RND family efflux transporter MFP subunit
MLAMVALLAAAVAGCDNASSAGGSAPGGSAPPTQVGLSRVEWLTVDRTVEAVGSLFADQDAVISAKVSGRLLAVTGDVGDRFPADTVLAQIDPVDYRMAVQQREFALKQTLAELGLSALPGSDFDPQTVPTVARARFEVDNALARLERVRKLFEVPQPLIPEQEFTDRKTEYEVARRNLEVAELAARSLLAQARTRDAERAAAEQRLMDATIRTPPAVPGSPGEASAEYAIAERRVTVGEYVREGDPLFRIVRDSTIRFRASVAERFSSELQLDQQVRLHVEGRPREFVGRVARISPAIDPVTRTFQIEADFVNADRQLRPGAFGRARIVVGQQSGVARVPAAAVVSFAGIDRVYSVADGKAVEHRVTKVPEPNPADPATASAGPLVSAGASPFPSTRGILVQGLPPEITEVVTQGAQRLSRGVLVTIGAGGGAGGGTGGPSTAPR